KETNAQSLQFALKCLEGAYGKFFDRKAKFPKFKCKNSKQSFCVPQDINIKNSKLYISKFREGIKIIAHRSIEGKIKHATISKNKAGQYFACICVERNIKKLPKVKSKIGVDLGVKTLATCSNGKSFRKFAFKETLTKRLVKLQQWFARTTKGTKLHEKIRNKIAKLWQKLKNSREDYLHKVSRKIIDENQVIILEDLNVNGMLKNHCIAKGVQNSCLSELVRQIKYKANWYGRTVAQISRWFPSSKTCNNCGYIKQDLMLESRKWICPRCNSWHDRDLNAAKNICKQGANMLNRRGYGDGLGTGGKTSSVVAKSFKKHSRMKQETPKN
ncbi:MAG: IS200/IS605 family element transposase accessory protein TnpB, partial [Candidatus Dadabacteria bacterium]|nr:IS200/IS605 family element transposase accessory protein TnpB [Candidatus Dadabacteria bacterium]